MAFFFVGSKEKYINNKSYNEMKIKLRSEKIFKFSRSQKPDFDTTNNQY